MTASQIEFLRAVAIQNGLTFNASGILELSAIITNELGINSESAKRVAIDVLKTR